jgi:hypothetical protein
VFAVVTLSSWIWNAQTVNYCDQIRSVFNDFSAIFFYFRHLDLLPLSRIVFERARLHCDSCALVKIKSYTRYAFLIRHLPYRNCRFRVDVTKTAAVTSARLTARRLDNESIYRFTKSSRFLSNFSSRNFPSTGKNRH